jgi:hypothetical protein
MAPVLDSAARGEPTPATGDNRRDTWGWAGTVERGVPRLLRDAFEVENPGGQTNVRLTGSFNPIGADTPWHDFAYRRPTNTATAGGGGGGGEPEAGVSREVMIETLVEDCTVLQEQISAVMALSPASEPDAGAPSTEQGRELPQVRFRNQLVHSRVAIGRLLRQLHPELTGLTRDAISTVESFASLLLVRLVTAANAQADGDGADELTQAHMAAAVEQTLPGELAAMALSEGRRKVARYHASIEQSGGSISEWEDYDD